MFDEQNQNDFELESLHSDCTLSEDELDLSTDQTRFIPVAVVDSKKANNRILNQYIERFQSIIRDNQTHSIVRTQSFEQNEFIQGEFRLSYNRTQLLKSGYPILSNESFPFYSLCYLVCTLNRSFPCHVICF